MRAPVFRLVVAVFALALPKSIYAQQSGLLVLVPPTIDASIGPTCDISGAYMSMHGPELHAGGLDVSVYYGQCVSSGSCGGYTLGTALVENGSGGAASNSAPAGKVSPA